MIVLPPSEVVSYVNDFGVAALYAVAVPCDEDMVAIGTATHIKRSAATLAYKHRDLFRGTTPDVLWAMWCDRAAAGRICQAVAHHYKGGLVQMALRTAVGLIVGTAKRYGVGLTTHEILLERVGAATGKIAAKIEGSRQSGGLSAFNAEFKRRRMLAQRAGTRFPTYGAALRRLRAAMASAAATGGAATPLATFNQVFDAD